MRVTESKLFVAILLIGGCAADPALQPPVEYYSPVRRQAPSAPVYSRVMWTHPPEPIPPRIRSEAPLLSPNFSFDLRKVTVVEAMNALGAALGYRTSFPYELAQRKVTVKMVGSADLILERIAEQIGAEGEIDSEQRVIRLIEPSMVPRLKTSGADLPSARDARGRLPTPRTDWAGSGK